MKKFLSFLFVGLLLASCHTPTDLVYFQDVKSDKSIKLQESGQIRFQPEDKLTIYVKTRDSQISQLFTMTSSNSNSNVSTSRAYTIDSEGNIDFPELGSIHVAGKTREEVANYIKEELANRNLVKNAVILVDFRSLYYNMLGEVKSPGRYEINKDHVTIVEAIADAGDLTINGLRTNILVMRKEGNEVKNYRVNLLNAEELIKSPVYQLRQDDVVYVEANPKKLRESMVNGNNTLTVSFWMSAASFLMGFINWLK